MVVGWLWGVCLGGFVWLVLVVVVWVWFGWLVGCWLIVWWLVDLLLTFGVCLVLVKLCVVLVRLGLFCLCLCLFVWNGYLVEVRFCLIKVCFICLLCYCLLVWVCCGV